MRILVVDDDRIVLESCERVLADAGHEVISSASTRAALKILEHGKFDLVLVDIKMPEYDGIEFTRAVRRGSSTLPIVAMSGYPTEQTVAEALATGAQCFVPKPFLPDELIRAIASATGKGS